MPRGELPARWTATICSHHPRTTGLPGELAGTDGEVLTRRAACPGAEQRQGAGRGVRRLMPLLDLVRGGVLQLVVPLAQMCLCVDELLVDELLVDVVVDVALVE